MGFEIERKFVLAEPPSGLENHRAMRIEQGYLALADDVEVRLRRLGDRRLLTVKGGAGEVRDEVEVEIDEARFDALWPLTDGRRLSKVRHRAALGDGLDAEIDVYEGPLDGLLVAEVEFPSPEHNREFSPPSWLGREVTGDDRYANHSLALDGKPKIERQREGNGNGLSRSYGLKRKENAGEGIRRIALGRAERALDRLAGAEAGGMAESIHGARKDLKKLRAVLRLSRRALGDKPFRSENRRYRDAGRLLSSSRDAEVKLETVLALRHRFDSAFPSDAAVAWEGALERERDELAGGEGGDRQPIEQAMEMVEEGRERVLAWQLTKDSWQLVGPGLTKSYRLGRQGLNRTLAEPSAESVHEWRKRSKDLWYQLRIVREAWPDLLEPTVDQAHGLADLLGDHHDLAILREDLDGREIERRVQFEELIAKRQGELLDDALELGKRLYAEKPKAFSRRIESYWAAWRA